jgi:Txe/YoeB family toxin of Txe-Axe toxin-antitoxin module
MRINKLIRKIKMSKTNSYANRYDRQDEMADYYSDRIRDPKRTVQTYKKLLWNERKHQIGLLLIDKHKEKWLQKEKKEEKFFRERLGAYTARIQSPKRTNTRSIFVTKSLNSFNSNDEVTELQAIRQDKSKSYEVHLRENRRLSTKFEKFLTNFKI